MDWLLLAWGSLASANSGFFAFVNTGPEWSWLTLVEPVLGSGDPDPTRFGSGSGWELSPHTPVSISR